MQLYWRINIYIRDTHKLCLGLGRAETERADVRRTDRRLQRIVGRRRRGRPLAQDHTWLIDFVQADRQHGLQVRDVARRQADRLDLGQFPVGRLGWYQSAERRERRVDAVCTVSLAGVGRSAGRPCGRRSWRRHGGVGRRCWIVHSDDGSFVVASTRQLRV